MHLEKRILITGGAGFQEVQARQHHRQESLAMAEIVFELVAVIFHHVEAFVLDFPSRPAAGDDFGDILFRDGKGPTPWKV